jgi:hypothetical protein
MTHLSIQLARLGDALETAAAADLARSGGRLRRLPRRRVLLLAATLAIVIPGGGAIAAALLSGHTVSSSVVAGGTIFEGTHPHCTAEVEGVQYLCTIDKPAFPLVDDFTNVAYQTVDATQHVNGGCRSLNAKGTTWRCWIGQAAVDHQIISQDFLGELQTTPATG